MIQTAAIIWAVLATGLGIWACVGWRRCEDRANGQSTGWDMAAAAGEHYRLRAIDAEGRLRAIERQRSETTRRGNLTRSAKRRAAVASTTEQIRKEIGR